MKYYLPSFCCQQQGHYATPADHLCLAMNCQFGLDFVFFMDKNITFLLIFILKLIFGESSSLLVLSLMLNDDNQRCTGCSRRWFD